MLYKQILNFFEKNELDMDIFLQLMKKDLIYYNQWDMRCIHYYLDYYILNNYNGRLKIKLIKKI